MTIKLIMPQKFKSKKKELEDFIKRKNPALFLEKFTGRKVKSNIIFRHKPIKMEARFKDNNIYADFNNKTFYLWICVCHELAHIILENPAWYKNNKEINKIIKEHKERVSKKYSFKEAIEQTVAILLQAACEDKARIRKLKWSEWELTFDYMGVRELGKKFWKDWLKYLKNLSRYRNIDDWILEELKKTKF